jgi:hypothetical protein
MRRGQDVKQQLRARNAEQVNASSEERLSYRHSAASGLQAAGASSGWLGTAAAPFRCKPYKEHMKLMELAAGSPGRVKRGHRRGAAGPICRPRSRAGGGGAPPGRTPPSPTPPSC